MGRKKSEEPAAEPKADESKKEEEPEDPPVVKELKSIDDEYLKLENEYKQALAKLTIEFELKQQPMLEQRRDLLIAPKEGESATGTPALSGFWLQALKNHPAFEDVIQEWDEPVLEFLKDITRAPLVGGETYEKGFILCFHFESNPYFEQTLFTKEYHTEEASPYTGEISVKLIKCDAPTWKPGKDVTVEKVAKKVKGGGAKKAKQKKEKEEARESFFRLFFRTLKEGDDMPEDIMQMMLGERDEDDEDDDEELLVEFMDNDHEVGSALKDQIIPFAVRWYTGEAAPESDDDDEDSEEEDDEDDEEDDDEDDSDEDPAPKKGGKKGGKNVGSKKSPKDGPAAPPKEECKQQ